VTATSEQLSCQELVELVTDYLEGALTEDDRRRFEDHLATCDGCRAYLDQMRVTIRVAGELTPEDFPPEAERALLEAFRGWNAGGV
jgi:anti-sigma factor RsiW